MSLLGPPLGIKDRRFLPCITLREIGGDVSFTADSQYLEMDNLLYLSKKILGRIANRSTSQSRWDTAFSAQGGREVPAVAGIAVAGQQS